MAQESHLPSTSRSPRIAAIKQKLDQLDRICSGTLLERTKVCGKAVCRCASDPDQRHGPYFEWNRREDGVLRHHNVTAEQAEEIRRGIDNYQRLLAWLADWESDSVDSILGPERRALSRGRR